MIKESVTVDDVIALLNEAIALDPDAMHSLVSARVTCNDALARHSTIQVALEDREFKVGIIGILNGIFGKNERGLGPVAGIFNFSLENEAAPVLTTFVRTADTRI
ncbi:MAG: hypothetical protein PHI24_09135 [Desulfitobacteriaceae bacterium]|nr:hypothetical protein [Desulfitobacteriaceae bacterium]